MSDLTPLAQARAIVIENLDPQRHKACECRAKIVAGQWDSTLAMRCTLAALRARGRDG